MDKYTHRRIALCGSIIILLTSVGCGAVVSSMRNETESSADVAPCSAVLEASAAYEGHGFNAVASNGVNAICPTCGQIIEGPNVFLTYNEIKLLASLVELEAGVESYECKKAVASVIINRMSIYDKDLVEVIYEKNQFSVADRVAEYEPSDESIEAVREVLTTGVTVPEYVTFFRAGYYHDWGDQTPYIQIDNTYFSYSESTKKQLGY